MYLSNTFCIAEWYGQFIWVIVFHSTRVCQGPYDAALIKAWEDWDEKHGSENDHPKEFLIYQVCFFSL